MLTRCVVTAHLTQQGSALAAVSLNTEWLLFSPRDIHMAFTWLVAGAGEAD